MSRAFPPPQPAIGSRPEYLEITGPRRQGVVATAVAAIRKHLAERRLELLRADDLTDLLIEHPDQLALRIRTVSTWLGVPLMRGQASGIPLVPAVKLYQVEDAGVGKLRLLLTDVGVAGLYHRLDGQALIIGSPMPDAGHTTVKVQGTFGCGRPLERIGRANADLPDAEMKAATAARRALIYDHCALPWSTPVAAADMAFVVEDWIHNPMAEAAATDEPTQHESAAAPEDVALEAVPVEPSEVSEGAPAADTEQAPWGPEVAKEVPPPPQEAATVPAPAVAQVSPRSSIGDADDDSMDAQRALVEGYLAEQQYTPEEVSARLQHWLALEKGKAIKDLDEAELSIAAMDMRVWFPPKQAAEATA